MKAPVVLFVYNRPAHVRRTVDALVKNVGAVETELIVYCDGAKGEKDLNEVDAVRHYVNGIVGFKSVTIVERPQNLGLAGSIIDGVTTVVRRYGKIIVLEDDMVTSRFFLPFMNDALDVYQNENDVGCVHGYLYPVRKKTPETFFIRGTNCWGWATWERAWNYFSPDGIMLLKKVRELKNVKDFNMMGGINFVKMLEGQIAGTNNSWAIRWYTSIYLKNMYCLYPGRSLIHNFGSDGKGTHCTVSNAYDVKLAAQPILVTKIGVVENFNAKKEFRSFFRRVYGTLLQRIIRKVLKILKHIATK